jgi:hypothetical protein
VNNWHFNVIFWVAIGGVVFLLLGPSFGLNGIPENPTAATGIATLLAYVLAQKRHLIKRNGDDEANGKHRGDQQKKTKTKPVRTQLCSGLACTSVSYRKD